MIQCGDVNLSFCFSTCLFDSAGAVALVPTLAQEVGPFQFTAQGKSVMVLVVGYYIDNVRDRRY